VFLPSATRKPPTHPNAFIKFNKHNETGKT
jgi:hypothetical protein